MVAATMTQFHRIELRTTDVEAARAFYRKVLGHEHAVIWPLHEQALARGAKPHWIGHIGVDDVEPATQRFVERGAAKLGPAPPTREGGSATVLRDPGGAILALSEPGPSKPSALMNVAWMVLNTNDLSQALSNYRDLFGWVPTTVVELGAQGTAQEFAWEAGGESVGAMRDIAGRPGVHPHWLFFFEVHELTPAVVATEQAGGTVLEPFTLPSGARICVCDDPQGAAFGLYEPKRSATAR
jgi:uncharacterized protein